MILVTGGAYQGRSAYVIREYGTPPGDMADGRSCTPEEAMKARCITAYEELVRRLGDDCIRFTEELCRTPQDRIIILREVGCGIVPVEKSERIWRENVGRCGCIIAANSCRVVRIICGMPEVIKGDSE